MNPNNNLDWALWYAGRGLAVIPLHYPKKASNGSLYCSCERDCDSPAKHPLGALVPHGLNDASTDPATIREWFRLHPNANVAICPRPGLSVVDIDPRSGGVRSLAEYEAQHGALTSEWTVDTGGGGLHLYYSHGTDQDFKNGKGIIPGFDFKTNGGYLVAPPSKHMSGGFYRWRWLAGGQADLPNQIPMLPQAIVELLSRKTPASLPLLSLGGQIPEGQRNDTLTSIAGSMQAKGLAATAIADALLALNASACVPPLSEAEVRRIAASIAKYPATSSPSVLVPANAFRSITEVMTSVSGMVPWVVGPWAACYALTDIVGSPKVGKTTLLAAMLRAVLTGGMFLGQATRKTNVVLLTEERDATLVQALKRAGLDDPALGLHILSRDRVGKSAWPVVVASAVERCRQVGAWMLVVDTLSVWALHGKDENDSGAALAALEPLQSAAATGLCVVVLRHERKSGGDIVSAGRGSSAFAGVADIVVNVRRREGHPNPNVRVLSAISRFSETPGDMLIERKGLTFVALGSSTNAVHQALCEAVLKVCSPSRANAILLHDLKAKVAAHMKQKVTDVKDSTLRKAVDDLEQAGQISSAKIKRQGSPKVFWLSPTAASAATAGVTP